MKYAIIQHGPKQYRVQEGDEIDVDLMDLEQGSNVEFDNILSLHEGEKVKLGSKLSKTLVKGQVQGVVYGPKITSVKYKRSHHQYRKFGHRQRYTRVKITSIGGSHGT